MIVSWSKGNEGRKRIASEEGEHLLLYKYRKWNQNTRDIIANNQLHFSTPREFNDPFDCRIRQTVEGTYEQFRERFQQSRSDFIESWRREIAPASEQEIEEEIERRLKEHYNNPYFQRRISDYDIAMVQNNLGVCCFSSKKDSTLMWSHYADSHKGICLEFEGGGRFFGAALPVHYRLDIPSINFFAPVEDRLQACVLTKASDWAYEEEYRMILPMVRGNVEYPKELLKGVIFGCKMSREDKDEVVGVLSANSNRVRLYQAVLKEDIFGLDIVPI